MDSSWRKQINMVEDWLTNAYDGMSRRQFLAQMTAAGIGLTGFAISSSSIAGEVITTLSAGHSRSRCKGNGNCPQGRREEG